MCVPHLHRQPPQATATERTSLDAIGRRPGTAAAEGARTGAVGRRFGALRVDVVLGAWVVDVAGAWVWGGRLPSRCQGPRAVVPVSGICATHGPPRRRPPAGRIRNRRVTPARWRVIHLLRTATDHRAPAPQLLPAHSATADRNGGRRPRTATAVRNRGQRPRSAAPGRTSPVTGQGPRVGRSGQWRLRNARPTTIADANATAAAGAAHRNTDRPPTVSGTGTGA